MEPFSRRPSQRCTFIAPEFGGCIVTVLSRTERCNVCRARCPVPSDSCMGTSAPQGSWLLCGTGRLFYRILSPFPQVLGRLFVSVASPGVLCVLQALLKFSVRQKVSPLRTAQGSFSLCFHVNEPTWKNHGYHCLRKLLLQSPQYLPCPFFFLFS